MEGSMRISRILLMGAFEPRECRPALLLFSDRELHENVCRGLPVLQLRRHIGQALHVARIGIKRHHPTHSRESLVLATLLKEAVNRSVISLNRLAAAAVTFRCLRKTKYLAKFWRRNASQLFKGDCSPSIVAHRQLTIKQLAQE